MKNRTLKKLIICFIAAAILTAVCAFGLLDSLDFAVSDRLYLHEEANDGLVIVVGIDDRALSELGPMPWSRQYYADMINFLMSSPGGGPALIGIDVLFLGEGQDKAADEALVEACRNAGNVVVACSATYGSTIVVDDNDNFYIDTRSIISWDEPFDALKEVVDLGCINSMTDSDGMLRHALLSVDVPGVGTFKSLSRVLYEKYAAMNGLELNTPNVGSDGFFYLPYTSRTGAFYEGVSVSDLISGSVDPGYFDGRIVLLAPYAAGLMDDYRTSIDRGGVMYGIEYQANQLNAYRNGFFPRELNEFVQLAVCFAVCFGMLWFFISRKKLLYSFIGWLAALILCIGGSYGLYLSGHITHALWIPFNITILFIITIVGQYLVEQRERHKVTALFGKYVDPAVMKQLLEGGNAEAIFNSRHYDIAVLFVDIRGFTSLSENLTPEEVVELLNKYLSIATDCIMRYHGTLDKFIGDCAMAFWNAPVAQDDYIYLACCAARDLVRETEELSKSLMSKYGRRVSLGAGVNCGPAVVGNIGSSKRMDYTAIGDTVNTASRLESNAPPGTIYISEEVAAALGDRAKVTPLAQQIALKGKAKSIKILQLEELE